jgi:hypothetical protein
MQQYQGESLTSADPFGREPAFNSHQPQFLTKLIGKEGEFFNTTAGSGEIAATGHPFAFFPRHVKGLPLGFAVYFNVRPPPGNPNYLQCNS